MKPYSNRNTFHLIFVFAGSLFLLFVFAPMAGLMFSTPASKLFQTIQDVQVSNSIGLTLGMSAIATVFSSIFVVPFAWYMVRQGGRFKHIISGLIDLPMMIPHAAAGIALLGIVNRESVLGRIATEVGIDFVDRPLGIAVAMAFVSVPYLYNAAYQSFSAIPRRIELAAANLGATPVTVFRKISLPIAKRGLLNGFVMMFARGISEFGAVIIIAYHPFTTPVLIFDRFNAFGLKEAQAVSALFVIISLAVFVLIRYLSKPLQDDRN